LLGVPASLKDCRGPSAKTKLGPMRRRTPTRAHQLFRPSMSEHIEYYRNSRIHILALMLDTQQAFTRLAAV
jgi:hypothetical protein